jgi:thiol-disulfide isomerase/thioredoxin
VDLKGKVTLINIWATWCEPCLRELPRIVQLCKALQYSDRIQILTINIDDNPGVAASFIAKSDYKFPVLLAKSFVDDLVPSLTIPLNWIADANARLRLESTGHERTSANWLPQMLQKLNEPLP